MLSPAAPVPIALRIYLLSAERDAAPTCFEAKLAERHSDSRISQEGGGGMRQRNFFGCDVTRFERADL